ncbi:MAG: M23 family metallopeptidase [Candidatus Coatesbacteria bacterium]
MAANSRRGRAVALGLLLAAAAGAASKPSDVVRFTTRTEGATTVIAGENTDQWWPYHVLVSFPSLDNMAPSVRVPGRFVLPPASRRDLLSLVRVDASRGTGFRVSYLYGRGDPNAVPDGAAVYLFPWEHGTKQRVDQGYFGPTTHQGMRALDFALPEGAVICAARDGVVVATRDDSNTGGPSARYDGDANFIDILHADGTWANYAHLQLRGVFVKPGDRVTAGQPIGRCGHTGRASGPHLHFAVYRAAWEAEGGETIPTVFLHLDGKTVAAEAGRTYYAVRPGGPAFEARLAGRMSDADFEGVTRTATATGTVAVRDDKVDEKVFLWCVNGTDADQQVTVSFDRLKGFGVSKRVPYTRRVPARSEVYLLSLTHTAGGVATYEIRFTWRTASAR